MSTKTLPADQVQQGETVGIVTAPVPIPMLLRSALIETSDQPQRATNHSMPSRNANMKQLLVILTLALALSGCIPVAYVVIQGVAEKLEDDIRDKVWLCDERDASGKCTKWKMKNPAPSSLTLKSAPASTDKIGDMPWWYTRCVNKYDEGTERDQCINTARDKRMAKYKPYKPGSLSMHKRHANKSCRVLHAVWEPAHQECVDLHIESDRDIGRIE